MRLRARQRFGKYIIERRIAEGGFATVYRARDTIEGIRVALKIPFSHLLTSDAIESFRQEVRLAAQLEHPNILSLKYADYIDGQFVIVTSLGQMSLEDRLQKRLPVELGVGYCEQMLAGVAHAHQHKIIHCDIKPDNFLLFPNDVIRLTDFGIARVAQRTLRGSGTGTVGYVAPEQAMGKPSFRSDVFSLGVIFYRLFSGHLPEWPYDWPPLKYDRLEKRLHPDFIELIRRALELDTRKRFADASDMLHRFQKIRSPSRPSRSSSSETKIRRTTKQKWHVIRWKEFQSEFGKALETKFRCSHCEGPISESMFACPWCGKSRESHKHGTKFPIECPRCHRGLKSDWKYCPWCYGPGFEPHSTRHYADRRYSAKCDNPKCSWRLLMPFMRYCPWCHRRVRRKWKIEGSKDKCSKCGWGVLKLFWNYCPWCGKRMEN
ncbi:MAG: protein kinase [Planctomycetales bacterium]|nr:protein kinase [Planctomycetales bacterium]